MWYLLLHYLAGAAYAAGLAPYRATNLPLDRLFDNKAASSTGNANFDGLGSSFDSQYLPSGPWTYDGITYNIPTVWGEENDNVIANGQVLLLDEPTLSHELHFLYAGDASGHEFVANFVLTFADNTTQLVQLYARNWWKWPLLNDGQIQTPYRFINNGTSKNYNSTQIHQWSTSVFSESPLQSITFPPVNTAHRLHIFAMSLTPSLAMPMIKLDNIASLLSVRRTRFTTRWEEIDGKRAQAVEVTIANLLPAFVMSNETSIKDEIRISIAGAHIRTVASASIYRLVPGDQVKVDVFVTGTRRDELATVLIHDARGRQLGSSEGWVTSPLVEKWPAIASVLKTHETPTWWNGAKYGIFIHWGVYSYPAWASAPAKTYAEWYDWNLHQPNSTTWNHHLQTYGTGVSYDDFVANFTATKFNASQWIDLFDQAGAKYFVLVTKHHDGFALFDTGNTTHRSSVHLGPKRDFVKELLSTAKKEKPNLHRGTYYSLPEWFNPDSAQYGFGQWPGGLAHNPFNTSELEPYVGRLDIGDYIDDLQLPHMLDLAVKYETEIMWCDIGGPNRTLEFASQFYNNAWKNGRQVTMNNRCGAVPDFDTPEYATFGSIQSQRWESSEGMDPFSYGLNSATLPSQYKNGSTIVQTLVDIVSKNGNFLLDIGPTAEGEIIAPMMNNLLDAGSWLKYSGECVYDTNYWFPNSQEISSGHSIRFTTTANTFCIISFTPPTGGQLTIHKRLPIVGGDRITLLGPSGPSSPLSWSVNNTSGSLVINVPDSLVNKGKYAWAFQVSYAVDS